MRGVRITYCSSLVVGIYEILKNHFRDWNTLMQQDAKEEILSTKCRGERNTLSARINK